MAWLVLYTHVPAEVADVELAPAGIELRLRIALATLTSAGGRAAAAAAAATTTAAAAASRRGAAVAGGRRGPRAALALGIFANLVYLVYFVDLVNLLINFVDLNLGFSLRGFRGVSLVAHGCFRVGLKM
jgi:hypothetical protein